MGLAMQKMDERPDAMPTLIEIDGIAKTYQTADGVAVRAED